MSPASELAWRNGSYVRLTLLFENNNFTPLPELVWVMVLYSPSSPSLLVRRASAAYARRLSFVVASSCSWDDRGFESFSISLRVRSILIALLIAFVEV